MSAPPPRGGGAPAGGGMPGLPPGMDMAKIMAYAPMLISVATKAPAFIVGYCLAFVVLVFWGGRAYIREEIAPVAGFHVVGLLLLRVVIPHARFGWAQATEIRERHARVSSLAKDLKLLSHEPGLD